MFWGLPPLFNPVSKVVFRIHKHFAALRVFPKDTPSDFAREFLICATTKRPTSSAMEAGLPSVGSCSCPRPSLLSHLPTVPLLLFTGMLDYPDAALVAKDDRLLLPIKPKSLY